MRILGRKSLEIFVIAILQVAISGSAKAQSTWGYADLFYDPDYDWVAAIGLTWPDYSSQYYYEPMVNLYMYADDGRSENFYCSHPSQCSSGAYAWWGLTMEPRSGVTYSVTSQHYMNVYYYYYEMDPGCTSGCYEWYDTFGYTFDNCTPQCKADPNCFCVDVVGQMPSTTWYPPVIAITVTWAQEFLGQNTKTIQTPQPILSCTPSTVVRGNNVTCTVSGPGSSRVTSWAFSGGGGTASGTAGQKSWGGTMAVGGTVSVSMTGYQPLSTSVTVNTRSGWATPATTAQNGDVPACPSFVSPPPDTSATLGCSTYSATWQPFSPATITGGPNDGFSYYASNLAITQSFPWKIHPDVDNTQSAFAQKQYGNCGIISASNLRTNVISHESSSTPRSHYAQYVAALQSQNYGLYLEQRVAIPQENLSTFHQQTNQQLTTRGNIVFSSSRSEADLYGPNNNQQTGVFQGYINYSPYVSCN